MSLDLLENRAGTAGTGPERCVTLLSYVNKMYVRPLSFASCLLVVRTASNAFALVASTDTASFLDEVWSDDSTPCIRFGSLLPFVDHR